MRRSLTLPETLIAAAAVGLILLVTALGTDTARQDLKKHQTERMLATLDRALNAYHQATGQWPTDPGIPARVKQAGRNDGSGDRLVAVLATVPEARKVIKAIPFCFRSPPGPAAAAPGPSWGTVQDTWGQPLRGLTTSSPSPADAEAVAVNGGKPVFVSAGPDEQFGPEGLPPAADNLQSDGR